MAIGFALAALRETAVNIANEAVQTMRCFQCEGHYLLNIIGSPLQRLLRRPMGYCKRGLSNEDSCQLEKAKRSWD